MAASATPVLLAGPISDEKMAKPILEESPGLKIHGLIQLEFSDHYITPRGLDTENQGLIFQPLLLLFWDLYSSKTGPLNDVSLTTGVWNSWHTRKSGATPRQWNEIDPIVGLTFKAFQDFQFDAFYTAFNSQTNSYDTSTNLDLKLTYHDHFIKGFSINPYVEYFRDIDKLPVVLGATSSYYFSLGIDPTFNVGPVKVELPSFVNLVASDFYQRLDGSDGGSGAAVISTELKVSTPLTFIPASYGHWGIYAGVQYYHLNNEGLLDGNVLLGATSKRDKDLIQLHTGITISF
ncbi:MAG: hypothetical protein ABIT76_03135 [Chthoniobacterales bacterium]